jgi:TonB family C-terminal domain
MIMTREKIAGFSGSFLFCLILLLILIFSVLRTVIIKEEEGVLVNFGNVDEAAGMFEPSPQNDVTPPVPENIPEFIPEQSSVNQRPSEEPVISQEMEESAYVEAAKKKEEERKAREESERRRREEQRLADQRLAEQRAQEQRQREEQRRAEQQKAEEQRKRDEAERKRQEELRRQQAIKDQVAGAFGSSGSSSQGTASQGTGNQGSLGGNSDRGGNAGTGYGEFALTGRSIGAGGLPRPIYTVQEEGRIVIDIVVDPKGNVVMTAIGKGTNIDNASMRKSALDAAKKAKFNAISENTNQSGTITYKYFLK